MEKKIPSENETKIQILSRAVARGCLPEVKQLFAKYEAYYKKYQFDERAKYQMTASMIKELSDIDIQLILWLADEQGNILINGNIAFTVVDVPDERL